MENGSICIGMESGYGMRRRPPLSPKKGYKKQGFFTACEKSLLLYEI